MLHRADAEGVIIITQPAHAWLSGQMAQAWRDDEFCGVREEIELAATQHDIRVEPWPFARHTVHLTCEGRRLLGVFGNRDEMQEGLRRAAPVVLSFTLRSAEL